jgi:hypothetical protein
MYQQPNKISNFVWLILIVAYGATVYIMIFVIEKKHAMCRIVVQMDTVMFILQFMMYNFYTIYHRKVSSTEEKQNKIA